MHVAQIDYSLETQSLDIYLSGCRGNHCKGCHNESLWEFNKLDNTLSSLSHIFRNIKQFGDLIQRVFVMGGEPLDQDFCELDLFLEDIKSFTDKEVWLFTRYDLNRVPDKIKQSVSHIKSGAYREDLLTDDNIQCGVKLASSNQKVYLKGKDF